MTKQYAGELISEAVAVLIIIAFGDSVAAMYGLYDPSPYQHAYWGVCIAWGLAVTIAIYTTGSVSGCHANPAVTLALAMYRKFSWKKVLPYCVAQTVGALLGAVIVYRLYLPVIDAWNAAHQLTRAAGGGAGVFFTHPAMGITVAHAFGDEVVLTAFLIFGIFAITEQYNEMAPGGELRGTDDRAAGGADRGVDGVSGVVGDQSGTGSGAAGVLLDGGVGRGGVSVTANLLVGTHCGTAAGRGAGGWGLPDADSSISAG